MINQDLINQTLSAVDADAISGFSIARNLEDPKLFDIFAMDHFSAILACVEVSLSWDEATELQQILNAPYAVEEVEESPINNTLLFKANKG